VYGPTRIAAIRTASAVNTYGNSRNARATTMLHSAKTLRGYKLKSLDGELGSVKDFYFDDRHWAIRYLVANTGNWLVSRQVLISPYALAAVSRQEHHISIDLTRKRIENSPSLESDKPVSRQFEESYYGYFGWPLYWGGPYMWGEYPFIMRDRERWKVATKGEKGWDPHLRSIDGVTDSHIEAKDGEIGHVDDFIVDDETWAIRYLIVNTGNWWSGKKVLISTQWIKRVSWSDSKVFVDLSRESVKQSPEYTDDSMLTRDYEIGPHQHYNRKGRWYDQLVDV
jgi:uncharacterized protein YrrD